MCDSNDLEVGNDYILFLEQREPGKLVVTNTRLPGNEENLIEVAKACNLQMMAVGGNYMYMYTHIVY